jgi:hypothetical protein
MTLYIENSIADYWNTNRSIPFYPISKYIPKERFQELYICFRYIELGIKGFYTRVCCTTISYYFELIFVI